MKCALLALVLPVTLGFAPSIATRLSHATVFPAAEEKPRTAPAVQVVTVFPGMPAESIEHDITIRVERWLSQAAGVKQVESRSLDGISIVRVSCAPEADPVAALKQVNSLATAAIPTLPPGTLPPIVLPSSPTTAAPAGFVTVSSDELDEARLKDLARAEVLAAIRMAAGANAPFIAGGKERVARIHLDPLKLQARNLTAIDVIKALDASKLKLRVIARGDQLFLPLDSNLDSNAMHAALEKAATPDDATIELQPVPRDVEKLGDLVVQSKPVARVFLRDVAAIKEGELPQTEVIRVDGRRAVCIPVHLQHGADTAMMKKAIMANLAAIEKKLPPKTQIRYLPATDAERVVTILLRAPHGTITETEKTVAAIERFLEANIPADQRRAIICDIGRDPSSQLAALLLGWNTGPADATIRLLLADTATEKATETASRLRRKFLQNKAFANLIAWFQAGIAARPPVRVRLSGKDLNALASAAAEVRKEAARVAGAVDVLVALAPPNPAVTITVDREKAAAAGLTAREVASAAATPLGTFADIRDSKRGIAVLPLQQPPNMEELLDTPVSSPALKRPVPLRNLIQVERTEYPAEITRVAMKRVVDIWVNVEGMSAAEVARAVEERLRGMKPVAGVAVEVRNESQGP